MPGHRGRPRRSNEWEIRQEVLLGLIAGSPLSVVARRHGVTDKTVNRWADCDSEFAEQIAAARALGWDQLAAECLEIADDGRNDWMAEKDREGEIVGWRQNGEAVQRSKLRIDTRLRLLAVWDGPRYGERKALQVDATVTETKRHVIDPRALDDAGRAALKALLAQAVVAGLLAPPDDEDEPPIEGEASAREAGGGFAGARQPDDDDTDT